LVRVSSSFFIVSRTKLAPVMKPSAGCALVDV
jgi:hypothetical protein